MEKEREEKREAEGEIMVRRESNKNRVDLLRAKRGESKERENREIGHSKDFTFGGEKKNK